MLGNFSYFDIAFVVIALICIIVGYKKGFIKQLFALLKFAGSIVVAVIFYKQIGTLFNTWFGASFAGILSFMGDPDAAALTVCNVIGFLAILIVASIVVSIIGNLLNKATKNKVFGDVNRVFGLVYSAALLYVIVLGVDYGIDMLAGLEAVQGFSWAVTAVNFLNTQFQGTILSAVCGTNWLGGIIQGFITPAAQTFNTFFVA